MRKYFFRAAVTACFLVPSVMYIRDLVTGSVNVPNVARVISETSGRLKAWFTDQEAKAYEAEIAAEDERLAADIKDTEELIATTPSGSRNPLDQHLAGLVREREAVQDLKRVHLDRLNATRLANAEFRLMKIRAENVARQTPYAQDVLTIRRQQYHSAAVRIERQLAFFVNDFLDAIEQGDLPAVREASGKGLRPSLTRDKIRALAKSAPGGAMTFEPAANGIVVVRFSGRPDATLTLVAGDAGVEVTGVW